MTDEEEDAATQALIAQGRAIIPPCAAEDTQLARWLRLNGHDDLVPAKAP
jgi:hypothetical protein